MINNVNSFNAAKVYGTIDSKMQSAHNMLIDLLQKQIKLLNADSVTGLLVNSDGVVYVDQSLYQPRDTTLSEIAAAYSPGLGYFLVSDGEDSWTILSTTNVKSLLGISTGSNGESNWRFV
jgi:hypothetical protein